MSTLGTVYLLHFDAPYRHARHYTGWAAHLDNRLTDHAAGHGARLIAVIQAAGIGWRLARTWTGTRARERALKNHKAARLGAAPCAASHPAPTPRKDSDMAATFATVFVAVYAAHMVADHWVQTQHQADRKADTGWPGRIACATHILTYTCTTLVAVAAVYWRFDLDLAAGNVATGLAISAITHYIADRRTPLHRIANLTGSGRFYTLGTPRPGRDDNPCLGTGAYALDQSWHIGWLFISTLVVAA